MGLFHVTRNIGTIQISINSPFLLVRVHRLLLRKYGCLLIASESGDASKRM